MNAAQRRESILKRLSGAEAPVSASALAALLGVSRQIVVGDVALLRAGGAQIDATPRGYQLHPAEKGYTAILACVHSTEDEMRTELYTVVDQGGIVVDVAVENSLYGELRGNLNLASRYDVDNFIQQAKDTPEALLSRMTGGVHLHTLHCPDAGSFERIKKELEEMGMFAPEYKKPIPKYVRTVGVVTAPTGAAVRDIINITRRRNPYVQILLYPALVQGDGASESVVRGIRALEEAKVDVMIVGRGGGSIEDLWAFNEENVARAVFECSVPVISAVGHETDTTIIDYVADLRAPTPSAAAELAICNYRELLETIRTEQERMHRSMRRKLEVASLHTARYAEKFRYLSPSGKLKSMRQQLADYEEQIPKAMHQRLEREQERTRKVQEMLPLLMERNLRESRQQLAIRIERMKGLSPLAKLNQGFSYVQGSEGTVKKVADVKKGDWLRIYVTDGQIEAQVTDTKKE